MYLIKLALNRFGDLDGQPGLFGQHMVIGGKSKCDNDCPTRVGLGDHLD